MRATAASCKTMQSVDLCTTRSCQRAAASKTSRPSGRKRGRPQATYRHDEEVSIEPGTWTHAGHPRGLRIETSDPNTTEARSDTESNAHNNIMLTSQPTRSSMVVRRVLYEYVRALCQRQGRVQRTRPWNPNSSDRESSTSSAPIKQMRWMNMDSTSGAPRSRRLRVPVRECRVCTCGTRERGQKPGAKRFNYTQRTTHPLSWSFVSTDSHGSSSWPRRCCGSSEMLSIEK